MIKYSYKMTEFIRVAGSLFRVYANEDRNKGVRKNRLRLNREFPFYKLGKSIPKLNSRNQ